MGKYYDSLSLLDRLALITNFLGFALAFVVFIYTASVYIGLISILCLSMFKLVFISSYIDYKLGG